MDQTKDFTKLMNLTVKPYNILGYKTAHTEEHVGIVFKLPKGKNISEKCG